MSTNEGRAGGTEDGDVEQAEPESRTEVESQVELDLEDTSKTETRIGICVSGGGVRSAAFGLGVLQVLQQEFGLMRGPDSADRISAVSGGSYIAGAYTLVNNSDRFKPANTDPAAGEPEFGVPPEEPFQPGSSEAEYLRRHSRYLFEEGGAKNAGYFLWYFVLNLLISLGYIVALGVAFVALPAAILELAGSLDTVVGWLDDCWELRAVLLVLWFICSFRLVRRIATPGIVAFLREIAWPPGGVPGCASKIKAGLALALLLLPAFLSVAWLTGSEDSGYRWILADFIESNWQYLIGGFGILVLATVLAAMLGFVAKVGKVFLQSAFQTGLVLITRILTLLVPLLLALRPAIVALDLISPGREVGLHFPCVGGVSAPGLCVFGGLLILSAVLLAFGGWALRRLQLHNVYRDALMRCFGVIVASDGTAGPPRNLRGLDMSRMGPRRETADFPALIICAAANLSDLGATPAGTEVASIVFNPTYVSIPSVPGALIATEDMEKFETRRSKQFWNNEVGRAISLASAIAMTGAAVSPTMGRMTNRNFRAIMAAINLRLGVWIPNPANVDTRNLAEQVVNSENLGDFRVRPPKGALLNEAFGLHRSGEETVYVSDGGHYENLGLVEMLRHEPGLIWCSDASGDRPGMPRALSNAIILAAAELGARVEFGDQFRNFEASGESTISEPQVRQTYAVAKVSYASGKEGRLVVIKLGLDQDSAGELRLYRKSDRHFPHHSTGNQNFRAERFDAYRALGWDSAMRAAKDKDIVEMIRCLQEQEVIGGRAPSDDSGIPCGPEEEDAPCDCENEGEESE